MKEMAHLTPFCRVDFLYTFPDIARPFHEHGIARIFAMPEAKVFRHGEKPIPSLADGDDAVTRGARLPAEYALEDVADSPYFSEVCDLLGVELKITEGRIIGAVSVGRRQRRGEVLDENGELSELFVEVHMHGRGGQRQRRRAGKLQPSPGVEIAQAAGREVP